MDLGYWVLVYPLYLLYLHGPRILGFLEGAVPWDACADLTGVPAAVWEANRDACLARLDQRFWAYATLGGVLLYYGALARVAVTIWRALERACWSACARLWFSGAPLRTKAPID